MGLCLQTLTSNEWMVSWLPESRTTSVPHEDGYIWGKAEDTWLQTRPE